MIKGEKVVLDDFDNMSWEALHLWAKDPKFMVMILEDVFPVSLQDLTKLFAGYMYPSGRLFSIKAPLKGADGIIPVGYIALKAVDHHQKRAEVHIGLGDTRARKAGGLGIEAMELMKTYAFDSLGLHTLYSIVRSTNTKCIDSAKSCGFKVTSIKDFFVKDGKFINGTFVYINNT